MGPKLTWGHFGGPMAPPSGLLSAQGYHFVSIWGSFCEHVGPKNEAGTGVKHIVFFFVRESVGCLSAVV